MSSHYRSPINYAEDNLIEARAGLERFYGALRDYAAVAPANLAGMKDNAYYLAFVEAMNDDFNTRVALAGMYDLVRDLNNASKVNPAQAEVLAGLLKAFGLILGILQENPAVFLQAGSEGQISAEEVERLIAERIQAKKDKQYARADEVRKLLLDAGITLEDSKDGTTQWRRESV